MCSIVLYVLIINTDIFGMESSFEEYYYNYDDIPSRILQYNNKFVKSVDYIVINDVTTCF